MACEYCQGALSPVGKPYFCNQTEIVQDEKCLNDDCPGGCYACGEKLETRDFWDKRGRNYCESCFESEVSRGTAV